MNSASCKGSWSGERPIRFSATSSWKRGTPRLTLTATDLDTTFVSEIQPVTVKTGGAVTVPARRLYDVVRDLPTSAELGIKVLENHHVVLSCKEPKIRIRLNGLPATDYPTRPEAGGGPTLMLTFGALRRMVEKIRFAVSTEEMRLQLQGALLKAKAAGTAEMVATDGHRLALVEIDGVKVEAGFEPVLVSKKILDELGKLDAADDTPVSLRPRDESPRLLDRPAPPLREAGRTALSRLREGDQQGERQEGRRLPRGAARRRTADRAPFGRADEGRRASRSDPDSS